MKILILVCLFFYGCSSQPKKNVISSQDAAIDSLIRKNELNLISIETTNKLTDSTITGKVEKTVKQINTLKNEVKQLKEENNELKNKINDINDVGKPFQLLPVSNGKDNR